MSGVTYLLALGGVKSVLADIQEARRGVWVSVIADLVAPEEMKSVFGDVREARKACGCPGLRTW